MVDRSKWTARAFSRGVERGIGPFSGCGRKGPRNQNRTYKKKAARQGERRNICVDVISVATNDTRANIRNASVISLQKIDTAFYKCIHILSSRRVRRSNARALFRNPWQYPYHVDDRRFFCGTIRQPRFTPAAASRISVAPST
ncbi:hypothetical protein QFZ91_002806 [Paraburkholderia sp. JPY419]